MPDFKDSEFVHTFHWSGIQTDSESSPTWFKPVCEIGYFYIGNGVPDVYGETPFECQDGEWIDAFTKDKADYSVFCQEKMPEDDAVLTRFNSVFIILFPTFFRFFFFGPKPYINLYHLMRSCMTSCRKPCDGGIIRHQQVTSQFPKDSNIGLQSLSDKVVLHFLES